MQLLTAPADCRTPFRLSDCPYDTINCRDHHDRGPA